MVKDVERSTEPPLRVAETYLGDGAYAKFSGHDIEVWADRDGVRHWVSLEQSAINELRKFAEECWGPPKT